MLNKSHVFEVIIENSLDRAEILEFGLNEKNEE